MLPARSFSHRCSNNPSGKIMLTTAKPSTTSPWLLVDGYNIIGAWKTFLPKTSKRRHPPSIFANPEALEAARLKLIHLLIDYSAFQGYATQIVFDAYNREGSGHSEYHGDHLTVHFTEAGQTADTYIEKICAQNWGLRHEQSQRVIVATSDQTHKVMVLGYGADWMSAQRLADDVKVVTHLIRQKQAGQKQSSRRVLAHQLDPLAKQRLEQMRHAKP
jgi:uncharacterized protein